MERGRAALSQRLDLRQAQTLVMTPQLQQAIKLLQLSNMDLAAFVEGEIERNPLLEKPDEIPGAEGESGGERGDDPRTLDAPAPDMPTSPAADSFDEIRSDRLPDDAAAGLDTDPENVFSEDGPSDAAWSGSSGGDAPTMGSWRGAGGDFDRDDRGPDQTVAKGETLRDHLVEQLWIDLQDPAERIIGMLLIDQLDEAGYLTEGTDAVAARLGCPAERVDQVLAKLQRCDPAGVFARSLAECLALQLKERDRLDPAMQAMLANLELLAKRDVAALMKACGVDREDLQDMVAEIRALDPKPGLAFVPPEPTDQPVPDILMRASPGGQGVWIIELNPDTLPRVLVNAEYYARVSKSTKRKDDREYLSECFQSANWLVKSLHQRATTILKVATEIVRQQDAFFAHGVKYLRPLVLRDIADAIGMHESTVSRVTTNKFMDTPRGLFELKYFFTASIQAADGGATHSAESVRHRVRELIAAEGAEVLSDDRIVEILKGEGVDIARRTVAKYRESLKIPSSVQRRRDKVAAL